MKTIEQLLKPVIEGDINYLLGTKNKTELYELELSENMSLQSMTSTKYNIQSIIKFGQGLLTQIPGSKAVQTPLQLIFQVPINFKSEFIKIINTYILSSNAVWSEVTDDLEDDDLTTSETYQYRLVWHSPSINDNSFQVFVKSEDEFLDKESIEMVHVVLTGDVTSTSSYAMDDEELYLWVENGVESTENEWQNSNAAYYESQPTENRESVVASDPFDLSVPTGYDPESYAVGYALKVSDGSVPESAKYYVIGLNDIMIDGYVKIQGITAESEPLQPTINQTQVIDSRNPVIDINGDSQVLNITIAIQTSNILHKKLINMYLSDSRTNASFDILFKRVRKSLGVTKSDIECTMSLNRYKQNGFEYIQLTLARK